MNETGKEEAGVGPPAKRQRRPSVRLGDITPLVTLSCYNNDNIKPQPPSSKQQPQPQPKPQHPPPNTSTLNSFKRPLTNFTRIGEDDQDEEEEDDAIEEQDEDNQQQQQHSPVSVDSGDEDEDEDVFQLPSRKSIRSADQSGLDHSVRCWLRELGLARYSPVFQIHEVDFHVLPLLTLDDLKDMGILAVGSRRKLYAAILNLRKVVRYNSQTHSSGNLSMLRLG